ncbi:hypothetical protein WJX73_010760 [Symbiochloris irregularis]|uniref:DUF8204 domain-containing protein n=1 Tax=Symbiochloris irregularis TaxID=706552 RepID=A0AAW1PMF1_9CHLO
MSKETGQTTPGAKQPKSTESRPVRCLGSLYFSSTRFENGKSPVCAGIPHRINPESSFLRDLPKESIPGGDFKYVCIGASAFDVGHIEEQRQQRRSPTDPVDLPYCEGVEIISAAEFETEAVVSAEGAGAAAAAPSAGPINPVQPRAGRSFTGRGASSNDESGFDFNGLSDKMQANAAKILKQRPPVMLHPNFWEPMLTCQAVLLGMHAHLERRILIWSRHVSAMWRVSWRSKQAGYAMRDCRVATGRKELNITGMHIAFVW